MCAVLLEILLTEISRDARCPRISLQCHSFHLTCSSAECHLCLQLPQPFFCPASPLSAHSHSSWRHLTSNSSVASSWLCDLPCPPAFSQTLEA
jgi:hypothetical protein